MTVAVCAICLEPLTTGGAVTPVHAACLACQHPAAKQRVLEVAHRWDHGKPMPVVVECVCTVEGCGFHTTITDEPNGTDAPNQKGDDHAE
jgi:hypothetical protein